MDSGVVIEELGEDGQAITPLSALEPAVQRRALYLKKLHEDYEASEREFQLELNRLDKKYNAIYDKIFAERAQVVNGEKEAPKDIQVEGEQKADESSPAGIPRFWLTAMQSSRAIAEMIEEADEDALEYLIDIRATEFYPDEEATREKKVIEEGFDLTFEFKENPYFSNKTLTKSYRAEDSALTTVTGTKIDWKAGKNLTVKILKKKTSGKGGKGKRGAGAETKVEELDSFFRFFETPEMPTDAYQPAALKIQESFEVGELLKDEVIPEAILFFLGEVESDDEDDDDYTDEDDEDDESEDDDDSEDDSSDDNGETKRMSAEKIQSRRKVGPKDKIQGQAQPAECKQQ